MLYKNLNNKSLSELVNYSSSAIGKIVKGENEPKFKFLETLLVIFPEINAEWLITGKGTMLLSEKVEIKPETELDNTLDALINLKIDSRLKHRFTDLEIELRELMKLQVKNYIEMSKKA